LQTFDISHAFLLLTIAKLSTFKNGPVFLAHPVYDYKWNMLQLANVPDFCSSVVA